MKTLSYTDIGKGTPIVFIHGLGARKESWKHQLPLAAKHRLIMLDLRGHGQTTENENLTIKNFATDIIKLIDSLGIKSAYFCGLSLGGIVVQEIHVQRSDLFAGLILASTTSYIPSVYVHGAISQASKAFKNGSLLDDIVKRGLVNKAYEDDDRDAFLIRDCYMEAAVSAVGLNYFGKLRDIRKPVLLIAGSQDQVIPVVNVTLMKFCIRKCESVVFLNTGHLCNIEQAEKFNQSVFDFIGA